MTFTDIDILVQQGEGATLEFKEALSPASFARELVALANTTGGIRRIRDEAREVHCPEPEFEVGSLVTVTFRPNPAVRAAPEATGKVPPQVTEQVAGTEQVADQVTPQVTPKSPPKTWRCEPC